MTDQAIKQQERSRRPLVGRVVSNKMDKTVSVSVERMIKHPIYGKYIRRTTKLLAHDDTNRCNEGDQVTISECPPISKNKSWKVVDILEAVADSNS
jgi:small subunit ribosomal protein S17